jgi:hypothetical protein
MGERHALPDGTRCRLEKHVPVDFYEGMDLTGRGWILDWPEIN